MENGLQTVPPVTGGPMRRRQCAGGQIAHQAQCRDVEGLAYCRLERAIGRTGMRPQVGSILNV